MLEDRVVDGTKGLLVGGIDGIGGHGAGGATRWKTALLMGTMACWFVGGIDGIGGHGAGGATCWKTVLLTGTRACWFVGGIGGDDAGGR